jgi:Protein of unknown function (DUF2846)
MSSTIVLYQMMKVRHNMAPTVKNTNPLKKLLIIITASSLIGCASGPTFTDYVKTLPSPKGSDGRVWFYRPQRIFGAAVQPSVALNGQKIGSARPGGFFYADRPAGNYEVECTTEWTHTCHLTLAPQSTRYVRLNVMPGLLVGHVVPIEDNAADAQKDLAELHANN